MNELARAAVAAHALGCLDCGKCTASCPIPLAGADYSPRRHVVDTIQGDEELLGNPTIYQCLTCSQCDQRCPAAVDYTGLIKELRALSFKKGGPPECPHGGALQSVMRMMADGGTQQDRMGWVTDDLKTKPETGEVFFWTGCTPYYDAFFPEFEVDTLSGSQASVKLLNHLGVEPVVSPVEKCCGHDLLWNGDLENFEKLAKFNVDLVAKSGAKILVTPCAECVRTWRIDYEKYLDGGDLRVLHLTEYLAENSGKLSFKEPENGSETVTFQDPCRLGRHLGVYDAPRELLAKVPGVELEEMAHSGRSATCCAGGSWSSCDRFSKQIQVDRLKEARATGAEVMVTSCPKCQVHFKCSMKDPKLSDEIEIEMRDLAEILADALE
ncbi:MAG: (Fe-S)-binding protein [Planctomycetota bacterium]